MSFPTTPPIRHTPRPWSFPTVHHAETSWGLHLAAVAMPSLPLVQIRWTFRGGRSAAADYPLGATRLLANVARHGTRSYDSETLATTLDQLGARSRVNVSLDQASVSLTGQAPQLDQLLDLADELAFSPTFPEVDLERERASALEVHDNEHVHAETVAARWLAWLIYPDHAYGAPPTTAQGLRGTTRDQLVALHRRLFAPHRAQLAVVGDVAPEQVLRRLEARYATAPLEPSPLPSCGPAPIRAPRRLVCVDRPGSEQVSVAVGLSVLPRSHPDFLALRVTNQAFGGGASSRLFQDLRERRSLTYGCYSALDAGLLGGDLVSSMSTAPAKATRAIAALVGQWDQLAAHGISDEELEPARRYLIGSYPQSCSGVGGISGLVSLGWLAQLPEDTWSTYTSCLAAVSETDVAGVVERWIRPAPTSVVAVGPREVVEEALAPLGAFQSGRADEPEYEQAPAGLSVSA